MQPLARAFSTLREAVPVVCRLRRPSDASPAPSTPLLPIPISHPAITAAQRRYFVMCVGEIRYFRDLRAFEAGEESKGVILLHSSRFTASRTSLELSLHTEFRTYRLRAVRRRPCPPAAFPPLTSEVTSTCARSFAGRVT